MKQNDELFLKVYGGELTAKCRIEAGARIRVAFPSLPIEFINLLDDLLVEHGFSDKRLNDAVMHVIKTCQYPTPTMANFLSFDKRVKIYTYYEYCNAVSSHEVQDKDFSILKIKGKPHWVKTSDKVMHNIPDEI